MPRGVWNIHTPSPTESPPSPTSRTAPSNLLGGRTEDLGLAQTWPLPSLTGPWGGSGGCIHPSGWWLRPSLRAVGIPLRPVLTHRGARQMQKPPAGPVGSGTLGPGCPAGLISIWAAKSWGQWPRGTRVSPGTSRSPDGPHSQPLVVSVRHTQTHMYTYPHMAQMHAHTPGAFQAQHQSSQQRWTPLTRILAQTGAPSPPPLGPQALVQVASPPPHAVPSSSRLLVPLGPTEEEHPFPEPRFPLSLTRAFLCTTGCISASFPEQCCLCTNSPEPQAGPGGCVLGH